MSQPQRPVTLSIPKTLTGAAALTYGAAVAAKTTDLLARGPLRTGAVVGLAVLAVLALVRVLLKLATRRADPNMLDPASELTTLTFPPTRNTRPRVRRAK